jgi:hypothetical protein
MGRRIAASAVLVLAFTAFALSDDAKDSKAKDKPKEKKEWKSGIVWPEPRVVDPGSATVPPSDAIVLFDGTDMSKWDGGDLWQVKDGYVISRRKSIRTKDSFGDCQIHVEFASPDVVRGRGQGRGNSGVYIMDRYEIQILDSYDNATYFDGQCGAVYKQMPPMVNACRKPGEWQTYDILWEAPHFKADGSVEKPAHVTVLQNGIVIQNHTELIGTTGYYEAPKYQKHPEKAPLQLQFHGHPVRFRNIWVREMVKPVGKKPAEKVQGG